VNRHDRRAASVRLRKHMTSNPWWIDHLRRYPQVSVDAPEIPGRRYRICVHHVEGCAAHKGGDVVVEADCDCGCFTTKHLEPMDDECSCSVCTSQD
jgi:hypothetical protein